MTTRKPLSSPSWSATRLAANRSWPNTSLCLASALLSCVKPSLRLGMRTTWTGACGLMSRNANTDSSSYTTVAGISLLTILSNKVGAPVSSVTAAAAAVLAAASSSPLRAFTAVVLLLLHSLFEPIAVPAAARRRCPLLAFCKPKTDLQLRAAAIPLLQHGTIPAACAVRPSSAHLAMRDGWWYVLGWCWYVGVLSLSLSLSLAKPAITTPIAQTWIPIIVYSYAAHSKPSPTRQMMKTEPRESWTKAEAARRRTTTTREGSSLGSVAYNTVRTYLFIQYKI